MSFIRPVVYRRYHRHYVLLRQESGMQTLRTAHARNPVPRVNVLNDIRLRDADRIEYASDYERNVNDWYIAPERREEEQYELSRRIKARYGPNENTCFTDIP